MEIVNPLRILRNHRFSKKTFSVVHFSAYTNSGTCLGGKNVIGKDTNIVFSSIGFGSYIGEDSSLPKSVIGKYCSISSKVLLIAGSHPLHFVSSSPAFYNGNVFPYLHYDVKTKFDDQPKCLDSFLCRIGNDVWIGANVLIKAGISIGDGAIVGMGAVVTKDVAPYEVVVGIPAKPIKKRFSDAQICQLMKIKWWNWSEETMRKRADDFADIDVFLKKYGGE